MQPVMQRFQGDLQDPDTATLQTIRIMADQIRQSAQDDLVRQAAIGAVNQFRGGPLYVGQGNPWGSERAVAQSAWFWCRQNIRFVRHAEMIKALLNEDNQLQLLISPDVLVRLTRREGDCAVFTPMLCALLRALGIQYEIVTAAVDPQDPGVFSHVYCRAVFRSGGRLPLDASHGKYPGWEVPKARQFRKQVWDQDGNPVADQQQQSSLQGYIGLGDDGLDTSIDPSVIAGIAANAPDVSGIAPPVAVGSPAGTDWGSVLANQLSSWTKIAGNVIAPQQTIARGPGGQLLITGPAGSTPNVAGALATTTPTWLLLGGLAIGALFLFSMTGRSR